MENEDLEKEALEQTCDALKRAISRISYVGMGVSEELDKELGSLRSTIKKEGDLEEIKKSIDIISKILRTLDDENEKEEAIEKLDVLGVLLKKQLPRALKKQLKSVRNKVQSNDATSVMKSIAEVIEQYITQIESSRAIGNPGSVAAEVNEEKTHIDVAPDKPGFFAKLFSFGRAKTSENQDTNPSDASAELSSRNKDASRKYVNEELKLPQDIKDSLQHLIEQLASMDGYSEIAATLKSEIENLKKLTQLSSILEMITNAFIEISDQEHIQFEKFLKTLNKRIVRVNDFINQTLKYSKNSQSDSNQLNLELTSNISGIRASLSDSKSLEEAQSSVFAHMDTIVSQLNQFCTKQESNSQALVSQMDKLSEQLQATEDEATRLKDDLAEQRVRAQTDPLTKLPNRYSYNERLTQEYNRWRRYRNSLTLVMGDIDLFKSVNDIYGHAFGDKVLKDVAEYLAKCVRESDFIARFGGEEFVILMPETGIVDATRAMNKIRSGISKLAIECDGKVVPVTMSFGISEFEQNDTTKSVFERADKALYRAKDKGRNLVCCQRAKSA